MISLLPLITSADPAVRDQSLEAHCRAASVAELLETCAELDAFRRKAENLYERVRALFFLAAIHRFHLPGKMQKADGRRQNEAEADGYPASSIQHPAPALIPFRGYEQLLHRRFEEATDFVQEVKKLEKPHDTLTARLPGI